MSRHTISTRPDGHVQVLTAIDGGRTVYHEYFRRGAAVFQLLATGGPVQVAEQLRLEGKPLLIHGRATLEEVIRQALAERDGVQRRRPLWMRLAGLVATMACAGGAGILTVLTSVSLSMLSFDAIDNLRLLSAGGALLSAGGLILAMVTMTHLVERFSSYTGPITTAALLGMLAALSFLDRLEQLKLIGF